MNGDNRNLLLLSVFLLKLRGYVIDSSLGRAISTDRERHVRNGRNRSSKGRSDDELLLGLGRFDEKVVEGLEEDKGSESVDTEVVFKVFGCGGDQRLSTGDS